VTLNKYYPQVHDKKTFKDTYPIGPISHISINVNIMSSPSQQDRVWFDCTDVQG
jgi:hypothetical protein